MNDLLNKRFGLLLVKEYIGKSKYQHRWRCQCDCGNVSTVQGNHLIHGNTKSCGCLHKRKGKNSPFFRGYGEIPLDYFSTIRRSAEGKIRKSKQFSITIEYLWNLFLKQNRRCSLTGELLEFGSQKGTKPTASLDRIDSTKGYVEGNVQWVHKDVNIMKNDYDVDYFITMCKKVSGRHA